MLEQTWDLIAPLRYLQATSRAMGPDLVRMALVRRRPAAGPVGHRRARAQRSTQPHTHRPGPGPALPRSARQRPRRPPRSSRRPPCAGPARTCWPRPVRTPRIALGHGSESRRSGTAAERGGRRLRAARRRVGRRPSPIGATHLRYPAGAPRAAPPLLRMGQPDPDRAEGGRPRGRGSHESPDRRAAVRRRGAPSPPTSSTCSRSSATPTGSSSPPTQCAEPSAMRRRQQLRQHPEQPEPTHEGNLRFPRTADPAGGGIDRIEPDRDHHDPDRASPIGHRTSVTRPMLRCPLRDGRGATHGHIGHLTDAPRTATRLTLARRRGGRPWPVAVRPSSRSLRSLRSTRRPAPDDATEQTGDVSDGGRPRDNRSGDDASIRRDANARDDDAARNGRRFRCDGTAASVVEEAVRHIGEHSRPRSPRRGARPRSRRERRRRRRRPGDGDTADTRCRVPHRQQHQDVHRRRDPASRRAGEGCASTPRSAISSLRKRSTRCAPAAIGPTPSPSATCSCTPSGIYDSARTRPTRPR